MRALLYGDISLNILDGSSIWVLSVARALSTAVDTVDLLIKEQLYTDKLVRQISDLENVHLVPHVAGSELYATSAQEAQRLSPAEAAKRIQDLDAEASYDIVLIRGLRVSSSVASLTAVAARTWAYITDLPYPPSESNSAARSEVARASMHMHAMLSQTEEARSYLEAIAPAAAGKTHLMPPIIPTARHGATTSATMRGEHQDRYSTSPDRPLRICYAGKFAKDWMTLEILHLPSELKKLGIDSELWIIGDKFQDSPRDPEWATRMRNDLNELAANPESGVIYFGSMERSNAIDTMSRCDLGLSWRAADLDSSLELSTKVLEYLSAGVTPLINNSPANRNLLGSNYQGFLPATTDPSAIAQFIAQHDWRKIDPSKLNDLSNGFTVQAAAVRLQEQFSSLRHLSMPRPKTRKVSVTIASHDPKFLGEIQHNLNADPDFDIYYDAWKTLHINNPESSMTALSRSDIVFCEWAGPNLNWYSHRVRGDQALVCRFHGFEINGPWMNRVDFDTVDHIAFVSSHHRDAAIERFGIDPSKTSIIPNAINTKDLHRPKLPGHEFRLGLLGYVPFLKRPDKALDTLYDLLAHDSRYVLHIKGRPPWEYPHVWNNPVERQLYLEFFARIRSDSSIRNNVVFEPFSADIGSWLRKIGVVLSPSDKESFHLAPAEGMASGAIPVVWDREGASDIFGAQHVHMDMESRSKAILSLRNDDTRFRKSDSVRRFAARWSTDNVLDQWKSIIRQSVANYS